MESTLNEAPDRRRRRVIPIIDSRFQWKYSLLLTAVGVAIGSAMGGLLYNTYIESTNLMKLFSEELRREVSRHDQIFLLYVIVSVIVLGIALMVWGLIVTHRISGPLYIVARYLDIMAGGEYPDLRPLRKKDELQEFFASFEEAVTALRTRDQRRLNTIEAALKDGNQAAATEALEKLRKSLSDSLGEPDGVL